MQVISQNRDYTFNFRNRDIKILDNIISVVTNTGVHVIGIYTTSVRGQSVFNEMVSRNMKLGIDEIYYMPKE